VLREEKRLRAWETQLLPTVVQLGEGLAAGRSFEEAVTVVGRTGRTMVAGEFALMSEQLREGANLETALASFRKRAACEDVDFLTAAVLLQHRSGGTLAPLLHGISETLRERARLRDLVRTLTAQGRYSAQLLALLPVALGFFMWVMVPTYVSKLWSLADPGSPLNALPLLACMAAEVAGYLWIRHLTELEC
jgi:tight adherence protein B